MRPVAGRAPAGPRVPELRRPGRQGRPGLAAGGRGVRTHGSRSRLRELCPGGLGVHLEREPGQPHHAQGLAQRDAKGRPVDGPLGLAGRLVCARFGRGARRRGKVPGARLAHSRIGGDGGRMERGGGLRPAEPEPHQPGASLRANRVRGGPAIGPADAREGEPPTANSVRCRFAPSDHPVAAGRHGGAPVDRFLRGRRRPGARCDAVHRRESCPAAERRHGGRRLGRFPAQPGKPLSQQAEPDDRRGNSGLRIERTKRELTGTDKSIHQIAAQVGFASPRTLHDAFRAAVGCTPTEFRKRGREN